MSAPPFGTRPARHARPDREVGHRRAPTHSFRVRLARLMAGLVLCGTGLGLMVAGNLGVAPWAVLDQGISRQTGISIGTASITMGGLLLLLWIPLRERPGIGTILNAITIGLVMDMVLLVVHTPEALGGRLAYTALGVFLFGPGSGLYIGARLGPGPRDGLMTGLARRGVGSIRLVRTGLEVSALATGWLLGGTVGLGTLAFALTIGPNVQFFLGRLGVPDHPPPPAPPDGPQPTPEVGQDSRSSTSAQPPSAAVPMT